MQHNHMPSYHTKANSTTMDNSTISSQSDEEDEVKRFRKLVNDAVIQAFISIDSKSVRGEESLITVVKFIKHCMEVSPQVFIETKPTSADNISMVFSTWLLQQIYAMLSMTHIQSLHEAYIELIISLMELIQSKSVSCFNSLSNDFLQLLCKLSIFYGQYQIGEKKMSDFYFISPILSAEPLNTLNLDLAQKELKFKGEKEFQIFMCNILKIFQCNATSALLSSSNVSLSWKVLFSLIIYGDLPLKKCSIDCSIHLYHNYGFCNDIFLKRQFNNLILAVIKMLCSTYSEDQNNVEIDALKSSMNSCIQEVYQVNQTDNVMPFSEVDLENTLAEITLLLQKLSPVASKLEDIISILCHVVVFILSCLSGCDPGNFVPLIKTFFKFMIENVIAIYDQDLVVESIIESAVFLQNACHIQAFDLQNDDFSVVQFLTNSCENIMDSIQVSGFDKWQRQIDTIIKVINKLEQNFRASNSNLENLSDGNPFQHFLAANDLKAISDRWLNILQGSQCSGQVYRKIIASIHLILRSKCKKNSLTEFLEESAHILTLPWSIVERPAQNIQTIPPDTLNFETKRLIVESIACLENRQLKTHAFQTFMKADRDMKVLVFKMLPVLIHSDVCNLSTFRSWSSVLKDEAKDCVVGWTLPCALAKQTKVCDTGDNHVLKCISCDECSSNAEFVSSEDLMFINDSIISANMIAKRKSMLSLSRIFAHSNDKTSLLNIFCDYLTDPDYEVRLIFAEQLSEIISKSKDEVSSFYENLDGIFRSKYVDACSSGNVKLQETVIQAVSVVAQQLPLSKIKEMVILLLESIILSNIPTIKATAKLEIKKLWKQRNLSSKSFFHEFEEQICKFIYWAMNEASQSGMILPEDVASEVASVFQFSSVKSCMQSCLWHLLPILVSQICSTSSDILKWLTQVLKKRHRELFMENLNFIFSYLICHCSHEECESALMFIQEKSGLQIESLLRAEFQHVLNELILNLSSHYEQVFSGLTLLASRSECENIPIKITSDSQMAQFLQPRFLGFLTCFDSQLLPSNVHIDRKRKALRSLTVLIQLMGAKYITPVRMKVMATLRIAIRFENGDFPELCCQAWEMFVRNLELPALGPMLNQILATLLPLTNLQPAYVASIFKFLIVDSQSVLNQHFCDIYFIPDRPEFEEVRKTLADHNDTLHSDLKSQITHAIKGVAHESSLVRLHALKKLHTSLQQNQAALYKCVLGMDNVDRVISQLVSTLMNGCRDPDGDVRTMIGECIGELGAIDPGRLEINSSDQRKDMNKIHCSVNEDNFVFDLISELVRAFLSAEDTRTQNCSAFAIQEVLQIFKCDGTNSQTQGGRLWGRFPQHVLEIITPLLHSKYKNSSEKRHPSFSKPIFCSSYGQTFKSWITHWSIDLLTKIKHPMARKVFESCKMIMLHDLNVAIYLLPRILIYVLLDGSKEEVSEVRNELLEVLNSCRNFQPRQNNICDQSDMSHLSAQVIFSCLDYLTKWIRKKQNIVAFPATRCSAKGKSRVELDQEKYLTPIRIFMDSIPKDLLAKASFYCQAYTRSLMHLEEFLRIKEKNDLQHQLNFLQGIFIALDEPDGVAGVAASRRTELAIEDQIALHENNGRYHDALACYEHAVVVDSENIDHHHGLLRCLLELDQPSIALTYAMGITARQPNWTDQMNKYEVEAAWKLGQWDNLATFLDASEHTDRNWVVNVGQILLATKNKDQTTVLKHLKIAKNDLMVPLSAASMENGAYQRGYQSILRLHMLTEIEHSLKTMFNIGGNETEIILQSLFDTWSSRADAVQSSLRCVEPLFKLRRSIFGLMIDQQNDKRSEAMKLEVGKCWLKSAKLARMNGHFQSAYSFLLDASKYNLCEVYYEKAEWFWGKGDAEQAIITLQKGIELFYPDMSDLKSSSSQEAMQMRYECAKLKLLLTRYSEESASLDSESIIKMYRKVVGLAPEWEDAHFYIGQAYDKILQTVDAKEEQWNYLICIVRHFGSSLQYGSHHVYQSLPKLFSIWLDFGTEVADMEKQLESSRSSDSSKVKYLKKMKMVLGSMNSLITNLFPNRIPPYIAFTAFPQLISQICHSHKVVFQQLKKIIAHLLVTYPNQAMWMIMAVSKSKFSIRADRCKDVFHSVRELQSDLHKFVQDAGKFTDCLIELSNKEPAKDNEQPLSMNRHFKGIIRLVTDTNFSSIMLPIQALMTVTLPSLSGPHPNHNPFVQTAVFVTGFDNKIEILASLQKPKRIAIRGSDGKLYDFMCKAKDDLRIDCRLMEFNSLVNKYLYHDPESRRRHLHIRTYCVTPINEECGLIEWVSNLEGLRQILNKIYKEHGMYKSGSWIMSKLCPKKAPDDTKIAVYKDVFLKEFPPVFNEWYLKTFPDPTAWYMAKLANARTTAVMSMVGYILGLGDRHGENINYDSSCGDAIHVDFNCLFNKGETFDVPEKVPFRLTQNMINAMGPLGIEGIFRKACEVTLRVMRMQKDTLMSVLKPFIHDPLVEWTKSSKSRSKGDTAEAMNKKAKNDVQNCEQRLKGIVKMKVHGIPLSIEGQVDYLIKEATDDKNLALMYIGWGAYL